MMEPPAKKAKTGGGEAPGKASEAARAEEKAAAEAAAADPEMPASLILPLVPITLGTILTTGKYKKASMREALQDLQYVKWVIQNVTDAKSCHLMKELKKFALEEYQVEMGSKVRHARHAGCGWTPDVLVRKTDMKEVVIGTTLYWAMPGSCKRDQSGKM